MKGGDLPGSSDAIDIFFDGICQLYFNLTIFVFVCFQVVNLGSFSYVLLGKKYHELLGSRVKTRNTHGTGCTLASCIAAELAKGLPMLQAVQVLFSI